MRTTTFIPLLTSFTAVSVTAKLIEVPTQADFDNHLVHNDRLLVSFTSRSLESIQPLNNVFAKSSTKSSTPFISINCDENLQLCHDHDINAYPTIRLYERNENYELEETRYRGPRTQPAIQSFIRKRELPILSKLSESDIQDFKKTDDIVVIAYLPPNDQAALETINSVAAQHHHDYVFGYTTSTPDGISTPSLIAYRNTDNDHRTLPSPLSPSAIETFLTTSAQPLISAFSEKNIATYMQRDRLTLYIFHSPSTPISPYLQTLTPLAKQFAKYVIFTSVDVNRYEDMASGFGIQGTGKGVRIVVHAAMNDNVFLYQQGRNVDGKVVEGMLMGILKGEAKSGQVFGGEAEVEVEGDDGVGEGQGHDEL